MFRPPEGDRPILIDVAGIEVATAEALTILDALIDWLSIVRHSSESKDVPVYTSDSTWQRSYLALKRRHPIMGTESRVVVPTAKIRLLNLNYSGVDKVTALEVITKSVGNTVDAIRKELTPLRLKSQNTLDDWTTEFLAEALLNVAQHSELRTDIPEIFAYLSASYLTTKDVKKLIASQSLNVSNMAELDWISRIAMRAPGCIDLSVSDIGVGVPHSLADLESKPTDAEDDNKAGATFSDDDFLVWALSAFGTRKSRGDFSKNHDAVTWRGLYRLLKRCTSYDGLIRLTSASGEIGCVMNSNGERSRLVGGTKRPPSPVTTIRAIVPVTAKNRSAKYLPVGNHELPAIEDVAGIISLRPEEHANLLDGDTIESYCAKLRRTIESRLSLAADEEHRPWVVIHLVSRIARAAEQNHGLKFPRQVDSDFISGLLHRILVTSLFPTQRFIHCFFPGTDSSEVHDSVREYLVNYCRDIHPHFAGTRMGVVGIGFAGGSRVRWIHSHPAPDPKTQDLTGWRLWNRLIAYQPEVATPALAESRLSRSIAKEIASQYLSNQIKQFRAAGTFGRTTAWFWECDVSNKGEALQSVRTRSGRLATQYLSVLGFCSEHPTFLVALGDSIADALIRWSIKPGGAKHPMVVVADTDSSAFLLKRLRNPISKGIHSRGGLEWFIADCISDAIPAEHWQRVVVFGDFRFEGTSVRKKFDEIKVFLDVPELDCAHIFLAVDQERGQGANDPNFDCAKEIEIHSVFRDGIVIPFAQDARELSVDPVTNDLISPEQTAHARLLCDLYWRVDENDRLRDISESIFRHGIERIGGRYSTVRWPVAQNLREEWCVALIAERLSNFIATVDIHESICFCYREESSMKDALDNIIRRVADQKRSLPGQLEPSLWAAQIRSHVFHGRQYFGSSVQQAISLAHPLLTPSPDERKSSRQLRLNLSKSTDEEIERPEFSHYVYIDNSAVTGKSIAEFLLAIRTLPMHIARAPKRVLLFPIVTRLSPAEEELLRYTRIVPVSQNGSEDQQDVIAVELCSLLQMRMRTYTHPSTMPLAVQLRELVQNAKPETDRGLVQISDSISAVLLVLNSPPSAQRETILAGSVFGFPSPSERHVQGLSIACVTFRQLLGLLQQGVPCTREITATLASIRTAGDPGLVNVLAMEPDLLSNDPLLSEIIPELRDYAVDIAAGQHSFVEKTNAIWVLAHIPFGLALLIRNAIAQVCKDDLASKVFVYLALYQLERLELTQLCSRLRLANAKTEEKGWMATTGVNLMHASLRQTDVSDSAPIEGLEDAKTLVVNYLCNGRDDHIAPLTVAWMKIVTTLGVEKGKRTTASMREDLDGFDTAVENWIRRISVPVQRGTEYLGRGLGRSLFEQVAADRTSIFRQMEAVRHAVDAYRKQVGPFSAVEVAWQNLLKSTIWKSSDFLYSGLHAIDEADDYRQDSTRTSLNNSSSRALLLIANSPIFILLSRMRYALKRGTMVKTSFTGPFGAMTDLFSSTQLIDDLPNSAFLRSLWFQACIFPAIWEIKVSEFDKICRILCDNLDKYANLSAEIEVNFSLSQGAGANVLWIFISSLIKKDVIHGKGSGLVTVSNICSRHDWTFAPYVPSRLDRDYGTKLGIGVELIELGSPPVSTKDTQ
jgi:hypothetical protein